MQGKKISFTIHNFKFKYVRQKNLHEGNILYFSLKVCKKTEIKKEMAEIKKENEGYSIGK